MTVDRVDRLASVECRMGAGDGRCGRAFLPASDLLAVDVAQLDSVFRAKFVESDDADRMVLLEKWLQLPTTTAEVYWGESHEQHAYLRSGDEVAFACVLASPAVVREMVRSPPRVVLESATFQVTEGDGSHQLVAALENWAGRVWPKLSARTWPLFHAPPITVHLFGRCERPDR